MSETWREAPDMTKWDIFPFTGEFTVKELDPPVQPEPPRAGDPGGPPCGQCTNDDRSYLWVDDDWRVSTTRRPTAIPALVFLQTREHHDLADLPPRLATALGAMIQRVEAALLGLGNVGRVHVNRWGDGSAHFHLWFFARPSGAMQLLGTFLPVWNGILQPIGLEQWTANLHAVAQALVSGGGWIPAREPPP